MKAVLTVLGSGTSMGVPTIGCSCAVCRSPDPRDHRTRPSVLVEYEGHTVVIDTTPDFRQQAIREGIRYLDAVLFTHAHADHILGLDDLRPLTFWREGKIPLYAHAPVIERLRHIFSYIFEGDYRYGGKAEVHLHEIDGPVELFGTCFLPVKVMHGPDEIHGYRFGTAAYVTDFSEIPEESMAQLAGLDLLFLDALRRRPHPTHSTLENSLRLVQRLQPRRAFFTHISHDLGHQETSCSLPENVSLAHDGLKLEFEI
ncbi:MAG TPA: MBL fold metallo-hydrolase [Terriglobales bacterium]|nr:MBL fold metallo-hydrolase [Terriglobales bacterium]